MTRPDPEDVLEDAGKIDPYQPLAEWSLDELAAEMTRLGDEIKYLSGQRSAIQQEIWRRAREANPGVETAGTAQVAGEHVVANVSADRDWEWHPDALLALQTTCGNCGNAWEDHDLRLSGGRVCHGDQATEYAATEYAPVLTVAEYGRLVSWIPKVDGRYFLSLARRGGVLGEALARCRSLKSARPDIKFEARQ